MSLSTKLTLLAQRIGLEIKSRFNTLATVATSGSYEDLANKPAIPTVPTDVSAFANDADYQNATQVDNRIKSVVGAAPAALDTLAEIATQLQSDESAAAALVLTVAEKVDKTTTVNGKTLSGNINLTPDDIQGFADVAKSGRYDDLVGAPDAQIQTDWNQSDSTKPDFIKNKPAISVPGMALINSFSISTVAFVDVAVDPALYAAIKVIATGFASESSGNALLQLQFLTNGGVFDGQYITKYSGSGSSNYTLSTGTNVLLPCAAPQKTTSRGLDFQIDMILTGGSPEVMSLPMMEFSGSDPETKGAVKVSATINPNHIQTYPNILTTGVRMFVLSGFSRGKVFVYGVKK